MIEKVFHDTQDAMRGYGLSHVPESGRAVEVGCNTGAHTAPFFSKTPDRYIGIDNQKSKIKIAEENYPQLTFVCVDCLSSKGEAIIQTADIFIAFQTLEHIGTPRGDEDLQVLSWLRKGAKVIISVPNFPAVRHVRFYPHGVWTKRFQKVLNIEELNLYYSVREAGKRRGNCSYLYTGHRL